MRFLATFGLILICCHAWAIETNGYLQYQDKYARTKVEEFLEKLKDIMKTGNETLGLPPLDPFLSEKLPINLDMDMIKLDALLSDVDVRGLSAYTVNSGDLKILAMKLQLDLSWSKIYGSTNYIMKGILAEEMPIYGNGSISVVVEDFNFSAEVVFGLKGLYLYVKSIETDFSLERLLLDMTGFLHDEEISKMISAVISDMVPKLVRDYKNEIKSYVHPAIIKMADEFLSNKTLSDILDMLG